MAKLKDTVGTNHDRRIRICHIILVSLLYLESNSTQVRIEAVAVVEENASKSTEYLNIYVVVLPVLQGPPAYSGSQLGVSGIRGPCLKAWGAPGLVFWCPNSP